MKKSGQSKFPSLRPSQNNDRIVDLSFMDHWIESTVDDHTELEKNHIPKFAVVTSTNLGFSETFIIDHSKKLKTSIFFYHHLDLKIKVLSVCLDWAFKPFLKKSFLDYFRSRRLKKFLIKNKIEAVLAEYGHTGLKIMNLCHSLKIPLIVHFHGVDAFKNNIGSQYYSRLFDLASKIIVVSKPMGAALIKLGAKENKLAYCPTSIDSSLFQITKPHKNRPIFLSVVHFEEKKSPESILLAFSRVHKKHPEAKLLIAGNGTRLPLCISIAQELGISDAVEFLGQCSHDEVRRLMSQARCFIQHYQIASNGNSEGIPATILEASACGLPIISTRHGGISEKVIEGVSGYLVEEQDIQGMADFMLHFLAHPEEATRMGLQGTTHVSSLFSEKAWSSRFGKILLDIPTLHVPKILPGIKKTFVLTICGNSEVVDINLCLRFLKKQLKRSKVNQDEFQIIVLASRISSIIEHDIIIEVPIPQKYTNEQGRCYLKTGIHQHLPTMDGIYCYIDNNAYFLSVESLRIFEKKKSCVAFASDQFNTINSFTPSCLKYGNLTDSLQQTFESKVDPAWSIWNSDIFLFSSDSIPFLDLWHNYTLKTFDIPQWKTQDQGSLIAAAWKLGLQDMARIPSTYNWIYKHSDPTGTKTILKGIEIENDGKPIQVMNFIGKNFNKKDKFWLDIYSIIFVKNSKEFKLAKKTHQFARKAFNL